MKLDEIHSVCFLGIGGIGMSAIARYFLASGKHVFGYDKTESSITKSLIDQGAEITFSDDESWIEKQLTNIEQSNLLVVYTPAIPKNLKIKSVLETKGIKLIKRSVVLGWITNNTHNLSVAGTHGKTTTSTLLSHILSHSGIPHVAFLGGISSNYDSNYYCSDEVLENMVSVTEADEFDRSFLTLRPKAAAITSVDADHLDIYGAHDTMVEGFQEFAQLVEDQSKLVVQQDLQTLFDQQALTYGVEAGKISARHVHVNNGNFVFDLYTGNDVHQNMVLPLPGEHNVENALAAGALAMTVGVSADQLRDAYASFKGVKRRFEFIVRNEDCVYIDDYAHHPSEIKAAIKATRQLYPNKKVTAIFQPHLFSRTRDFMGDFAAELSNVDELILMDIYPAREEPLDGITSARLMEDITCPCHLLERESLLKYVTINKPEVLLTLGAGDIDRIVEPLKSILA